MTWDDVHEDGMFDDDPALAAFARDLREVAAAAQPPVVGTELAAILADGLDSVTVPPRRTRRRRTWARVGVAAAGAGLGFSGLGVAGALPDAVQERVARVAEVVGVQLPDPSHTGDPAPDNVPAGPPISVAPPGTQTPGARPGASPGGLDHAPDDDAEPDQPGNSDDQGRSHSGETPAVTRREPSADEDRPPPARSSREERQRHGPVRPPQRAAGDLVARPAPA